MVRTSTHVAYEPQNTHQELRKLWDSRDIAGLFGPDNTLLIDDSNYKVSSCIAQMDRAFKEGWEGCLTPLTQTPQASLNPPDTAIHPPAWDDPERLATDAELSPNGVYVNVIPYH